MAFTPPPPPPVLKQNQNNLLPNWSKGSFLSFSVTAWSVSDVLLIDGADPTSSDTEPKRADAACSRNACGRCSSRHEDLRRVGNVAVFKRRLQTDLFTLAFK